MTSTAGRPPSAGRGGAQGAGTATGEPGPGSADAVPGPAARRPRWQAVVLVAAVLLGLTLVLLRSAGTGGGPLDPREPAPEGSRVLAELLRDAGTDVEPVSTSRAALDGAQDGAVLLVVRTELLTPGARERLAAREDLPVLLVQPDPETLAALAPGVQLVGGAEEEVLDAGCDLPAATRAGRADAGGGVFSALRSRAACYRVPGGPTLVRVASTAGDVTVLGSGAALSNERLDDEGNAALALGLLQGASEVRWLLPDPLAEGLDDPAADEGAPASSLLPSVVDLALLQLALAAVVLALARARRLGAVVPEPLPVVVRAAEVVEGRARLYRTARARGRAASALRSATVTRLRGALGLPASASAEEVVVAVSARLSAPRPTVGSLLYGPTPTDDEALSRLARFLDDLGDAVERADRRARPPRREEGPR